MTYLAQASSPPDPDLILLMMFSSKAAREGAVIRGEARDIDRLIGRDVFLAEIERRGYRAVENAGQIVIFCNRAPVRVLT